MFIRLTGALWVFDLKIFGAKRRPKKQQYRNMYNMPRHLKLLYFKVSVLEIYVSMLQRYNYCVTEGVSDDANLRFWSARNGKCDEFHQVYHRTVSFIVPSRKKKIAQQFEAFPLLREL